MYLSPIVFFIHLILVIISPLTLISFFKYSIEYFIHPNLVDNSIHGIFNLHNLFYFNGDSPK